MRYQKRRRLLIDRNVQGALLIRVVAYWLACVATIEFLNLSWQIATGPNQPTFLAYYLNQDWQSSSVRLIASVVLIGPIVYDMLRLSNRFAGPVYRMQRILRKMAKDGTVHHVRLRDNDYWHAFAEDLNAALLRVSLAPPTNAHGVDERPLDTPTPATH